jgi:hypothetical protein
MTPVPMPGTALIASIVTSDKIKNVKRKMKNRGIVPLF